MTFICATCLARSSSSSSSSSSIRYSRARCSNFLSGVRCAVSLCYVTVTIIISNGSSGSHRKQTFLLPHFLEVILSNKWDPRFGFFGRLLLHIDFKILLSVPERALLWAVLANRRRTLEFQNKNIRIKSGKQTENGKSEIKQQNKGPYLFVDLSYCYLHCCREQGHQEKGPKTASQRREGKEKVTSEPSTILPIDDEFTGSAIINRRSTAVSRLWEHRHHHPSSQADQSPDEEQGCTSCGSRWYLQVHWRPGETRHCCQAQILPTVRCQGGPRGDPAGQTLIGSLLDL